jgi:hypothetical protein
MKSYRDSEIKWYVLAYLFLLIAVSSPNLLSVDHVDPITKIEKLFSSALLAGAICTLSFVFDCLYTTKAKEILLFLGFTKMPGKTVFTRIAQGRLKDIRFDIQRAQSRYKDILAAIPVGSKDKGKYENDIWYGLSRKYKDDDMVKAAHRDFLLCRDLYTTTITIFILTAAAMLFRLLQFNWIPIGYLCIMLLLTNLAAHFKAHRFVNNVIAADLSTKPTSAQTKGDQQK